MKIRSIRSKAQKQQELLDDAVFAYCAVRTPEQPKIDTSYDPLSLAGDYIFPSPSAGKGSRVEELPKELTPADIGEFTKCSKSPTYFIENYCKIQHPINGTVQYKFDDREYLRSMVDTVCSYSGTIIKHPRQACVTSTMLAYALWQAVFCPYQAIVIGSPNFYQSSDAMSRLQFMYEHLPQWMVGTPKYYDKRNIELGNGSRI